MPVLLRLATGAPTAVAVAVVSAAALGGACLRIRPRCRLPRAVGRGSPARSPRRCAPARARLTGES
ncbi:hypothetical protein [Catenuloplanes indicus]|uniref:Uncharacterized protein n=1 Tax=Catenuloplanes indicus TaxID=137267 RepID=A0AAE3W412_9ACTN|nr:hypothetical protein [Catenuloplanes indicus]MDQ0369171.1 hypothetical protein [Catenuloplanes indicus]